MPNDEWCVPLEGERWAVLQCPRPLSAKEAALIRDWIGMILPPLTVSEEGADAEDGDGGE